MRIGRAVFFTDYLVSPTELADVSCSASQRLERGRDGQPRHRFREPSQAGARACEFVNFETIMAWPKPVQPMIGGCRERRLPVRRTACLALLRRLDASSLSHPVRRRAGHCRGFARWWPKRAVTWRRRRSRSGAPGRTATCSSATATMASHAWWSAPIPASRSILPELDR
jgi:hypothetical protein